MSFKDEIYKIGINEIKEGEFSGNFDVEEKQMSGKNYMARTSLVTKIIEFKYTPNIVEKKGKEKVKNVCKDSISHEINHHKYKGCIGCPQTIEKDEELFFEPMYDFLTQKGFSKTDVDYATNALQDTILHRDLNVNAKKKLTGIVDFFEDVGENNKKYTNFYEAHTKLNLFLWGTKKQKRIISKFYTNNKKVNEVLKGFYSDLNEGKFKEIINIYSRSKKENDNWIDRKEIQKEIFNNEEIKKYFLNENNWKEISKLYAKHFHKLMTPNYAMPTSDHSGAGTKGKEKEDSSQEGTPFQKERESKEHKKGKVMKAYKEGKKSAPKWIDKYEALDLIYEGLAEQIIIKAQSFEHSESLPISWYGEKKFDPLTDTPKHLKFGFDEYGKVELKKKKWSIEVPISVKNSPMSFPKIKFGIFDISASMKEDIYGRNNIGNKKIIPWGDNSKYHWVLMTQFGIFEYFKRNHLLTQNSISVATFGQETKLIQGYKNVKEHLLNPNFESSTSLNINKIKKYFEGYNNLIYSATDGEISNWDEIKTEFIKEAKKHSYIHFHIGTENHVTEDLRKAGLEVIIAQDGKGIVNQVIDLTNKLIKGV